MGIVRKFGLPGNRIVFTKAASLLRSCFFKVIRVEILDKVNGFLWGCPVLLLILLVGLVLSVKTNFSQIRFLPAAVSVFLNNIKKRHNTDDNMSGYRALCTALAATVGTGNIAGVAGAIALGGPGVVFWMWVSGILGMVIKFAEVS